MVQKFLPITMVQQAFDDYFLNLSSIVRIFSLCQVAFSRYKFNRWRMFGRQKEITNSNKKRKVEI